MRIILIKKSPRKSVRVTNTSLKKDLSAPSINSKVSNPSSDTQTSSPRKTSKLTLVRKDEKKEPDRKMKRTEQVSPRISNNLHLEKQQPRKISAEDTRNSLRLKVQQPPEKSIYDQIINDSTPIKISNPISERQKSRPKLARLSKEIPPLDEKPEERTLLGTMKRILEQSWFHGDISKENADSSLATNKIQENTGIKFFGNPIGPQGDFLIRLSFFEPVEKHPFTITKVDKKGVIFHQRIFYDEEAHLYKVLQKIPLSLKYLLIH